ncbi:MAG: hypothetical protein AB7V26_08930 [Lysobacterales bacterium]
MKPTSKLPTLIALTALTALTAPLGAAPAGALNPAWQSVDPIGSTTPLELKLGYRLGGNNDLLLGSLRNIAPNNNAIDLYRLNPTQTGVSIAASQSDLDTGPAFGLGDWCVNANVSFMPYIKNFELRGLRVQNSDNTTTLVSVSPPLTDRYTTSDCFTLNAGSRMVIAANNFDQKRIDYFESTDDGQNWTLRYNFQPAGGTVLDPFAGGFRDTHGSVDDINIGTTWQHSNGHLFSTLFDGGTFMQLGEVDMGDHSAFVGNGFLKEIYGASLATLAYGAANGGNAIAVGVINRASSNFNFRLVNSVGTGSVLPFQGVSGQAFQPATGGYQFHSFSNRQAVTLYDGTSSSSAEIPGYPFLDTGGPNSSVYSTSMQRIYVAGIADGASLPGGLPGFAVATLDPALVVVPAGNTAISVPSATPWWLAMLALTLLGSAIWAVRRGG